VAYLVRSFQTNARIRSLTTGTFNRIFKDRIAFRLSGANSVQIGLAQVLIRLSSKPYKHTSCAKPCQRKHFTEYPRDFHSLEIRKNSVWCGGPESSIQGLMKIPIGAWKSGPFRAASGTTTTRASIPAAHERATVWPSASKDA
jgi:hypothetical protein